MEIQLYNNFHLDKLCDLITQLKPHGHLDWPTDKTVTKNILSNFTSNPSISIRVLVDSNEISGYYLIEEEKNISRIVVCIGSTNKNDHNILLSHVLDNYKSDDNSGNIKIQFPTLKSQKTVNDYFRRSGFSKVRTYLKMDLDISCQMNFPKHETLTARKLKSTTEHKILADIQNEIFLSHWGYSPNTQKDITDMLQSFGNDPNLITLIANDQNDIVGYCWPTVYQEHGTITGKISMMGIREEFRGNGYGKFAVETGLFILKSRGTQRVRLDVDSLNAKAVFLYKTIGFVTINELYWWEVRCPSQM